MPPYETAATKVSISSSSAPLSPNMSNSSQAQHRRSKAVFAHYMVGTVDVDHAQTDVDDAVAMGFDGFALNIGDPTQPFVSKTLDILFNYTSFRYPRFKLFVSMDVSASLASGKGPNDYVSLLERYLGHDVWYKGPNGFPLVSTYSDGGLTSDQWDNFKQSLSKNIYFVPDFDGTQGYYQADPGWWAYWGNTVDGLFSWESAWPSLAGLGGLYPGDISPDLTVINGTASRNKTYMMPLSALQYKNSYGANVYRGGELNLPRRMAKILHMSPQPEFVEVISWVRRRRSLLECPKSNHWKQNDGPESHYIGNIWPEQNTDSQPALYATQATAPHNGWGGLIRSFIHAFKTGSLASGMTTPGVAEGVMWYKTILQNATCPDEKPALFNTSKDQLNWAVVANQEGLTLQGISNGTAIGTIFLSPGLNYGAFIGIQPGPQSMILRAADGTTKLVAAGGRCISAGCPDSIYNMNPQVVPLTAHPSYRATEC
ncbi:MAG: hypothetical protein M1819_002700 [Sarea resinae]|nr:MAG: hypothetical protein M1819_002700 [Sarea resinae]